MKAVAAHNDKKGAFIEAQIASLPIVAGAIWLALSPLMLSFVSKAEAALAFDGLALVALPSCALLLSLLLISPWASRR